MALNLNDQSPNGNTLSNGTGSPTDVTTSLPFSPDGHAAAFASASSQFFTAAQSATLKPTGNMSVSFWIKTSQAGVGFGLVQNFAQVSSKASGWIIQGDFVTQFGRIRCTVGKNTGLTSGTDFQFVLSTVTINDGTWHHVCFTYDGSNLNLYLDGSSTPNASAAWSGGIAYGGSEAFRIGDIVSDGVTEATYFDGQLDEVQIWGKALTGAENAANYNKFRTGSEANLNAYYPFEVPVVASVGGPAGYAFLM